MKIYISVDLEGINGVVSDQQVLPEYPEYERTRRLAAAEINAVAAGLRKGGATEIVVNDSHHDSLNIQLDMLEEGITLISGDSRKYTMMHGLDESFDGVVLLGYHAKAGTPMAILDHTYYPELIEDITINGTSYGELGFSILFAAEKGVPVIMVSGDEAAVAEAGKLLPDCVCAAVKKAQGRFCAGCMPLEESRRYLQACGEEAAGSCVREKNLYRETMPAEMKIDFFKPNMADAAELVPTAARDGAKSVRISCRDMEDLFSWRQVLCTMAASSLKEY